MCSCVTACPTGARVFGDLDDPDCELVKEIAATHAAPIAGDLTQVQSLLREVMLRWSTHLFGAASSPAICS